MSIKLKESLCRACNHGLYKHCLYTQIFKGDVMDTTLINVLKMVKCSSSDYVNPTSSIAVSFNGCPCLEYVPADNLEYLERQYEKKAGIEQ